MCIGARVGALTLARGGGSGDVGKRAWGKHLEVPFLYLLFLSLVSFGFSFDFNFFFFDVSLVTVPYQTVGASCPDSQLRFAQRLDFQTEDPETTARNRVRVRDRAVRN